MSLLSENIIPGNHGKIFETNAKSTSDLERIKKEILTLDGIKDVLINTDAYPIELTIHTTKIVNIDDVENKVKTTGFHAIPKALFEL